MMKNIITWDLGATKCAAAVVSYDKSTNALTCQNKASVKIRDVNSLAELTSHLEQQLGLSMQDADAVCIGAAGQYDGECLFVEKGYPYPMEFAKLATQKKWPNYAVIHDYSPVVCSTFTSYVNDPSNVQRLNQATGQPLGRRVALGVGTGVGLKDGILMPNGDFWLGTNEMGHIGVITPPMAEHAYRERHVEFLKFLRSEGIVQENEAITFEKILANQGIVRIHSFFDRDAKHQTSEEIGTLVREGKAEDTLAMFAWYLGLLVGTVQLTFMPDGGLWLTGGVVLNHLEIFDHPDFFRGIEASPTYLNLREQFPLGILLGSDYAFMGAAFYASRKLVA